jgi:hypothetical protein
LWLLDIPSRFYILSSTILYIFFTAIYIYSSFIFRVVLSIIVINILSAPYLPSVYALGISLLLVFKALSNLDSVVVEPGFILEAVSNYSLTG